MMLPWPCAQVAWNPVATIVTLYVSPKSQAEQTIMIVSPAVVRVIGLRLLSIRVYTGCWLLITLVFQIGRAHV